MRKGDVGVTPCGKAIGSFRYVRSNGMLSLVVMYLAGRGCLNIYSADIHETEKLNFTLPREFINGEN